MVVFPPGDAETRLLGMDSLRKHFQKTVVREGRKGKKPGKGARLQRSRLALEEGAWLYSHTIGRT